MSIKQSNSQRIDSTFLQKIRENTELQPTSLESIEELTGGKIAQVLRIDDKVLKIERSKGNILSPLQVEGNTLNLLHNNPDYTNYWKDESYEYLLIPFIEGEHISYKHLEKYLEVLCSDIIKIQEFLLNEPSLEWVKTQAYDWTANPLAFRSFNTSENYKDLKELLTPRQYEAGKELYEASPKTIIKDFSPRNSILGDRLHHFDFNYLRYSIQQEDLCFFVDEPGFFEKRDFVTQKIFEQMRYDANDILLFHFISISRNLNQLALKTPNTKDWYTSRIENSLKYLNSNL